MNTNFFCLFTLLVSHSYKCNADGSVLVFIEKSWLVQNKGRIDLKLSIPVVLAILPFTNQLPLQEVREVCRTQCIHCCVYDVNNTS